MKSRWEVNQLQFANDKALLLDSTKILNREENLMIIAGKSKTICVSDVLHRSSYSFSHLSSNLSSNSWKLNGEDFRK